MKKEGSPQQLDLSGVHEPLLPVEQAAQLRGWTMRDIGRLIGKSALNALIPLSSLELIPYRKSASSSDSTVERRREQNRESQRRYRERHRIVNLPDESWRPGPDYLTVSEASIVAGRSPSSVRDLIYRGVLQGERHGYRWFIKRESLSNSLSTKR